VLLDYNNLKGFIKVKALNKHRAGKINPIDALLRQPLGVGGLLEEDTILLLL
jgi:hypothetical protein